MTNQEKFLHIVELVKSAVENRSNKDWTLMHLDLSEAYELAQQVDKDSSRAYAVYRTNPEENEGKEFFYYAM